MKKLFVLKDDFNIKVNQTTTSKIIGLTQPTLSNILNRKVACRKVVAYAITKYLNKDAEINDYFNRVEERR